MLLTMKIITRENAKLLKLKTFFTGVECIKGHLSERRTDNNRCVICQNESSKSYKDKNKSDLAKKRSVYVEKNRQKINEKDREYRLSNRDRILKQRRDRFKNDPEKYRALTRDYQSENRTKIRESRRTYYREYMREKRKTPEFKVLSTMRSMVRRLNDKVKSNKNSRTEDIVGYTHLELKAHIESLFKDGMTWDNRTKWHVDHIRSIKSYLDEGIVDPRVINAISNLQPLWAVDNLKKGA